MADCIYVCVKKVILIGPYFSGSQLPDPDLRSGWSRNLQNLSGVLELTSSRFVQRESVLNHHILTFDAEQNTQWASYQKAAV